MDFNNLAASRTQSDATSPSGATTNLDLCAEVCRAERTRIAQDLHDTLLQGFFAVSLKLRTAADLLPADSAVKEQVGSSLHLMDSVLEEGRRAVQGLRS